jgi:hypothetical protein
MKLRSLVLASLVAASTATASAQRPTPQPFPRPGDTDRKPPPSPPTSPVPPAPTAPPEEPATTGESDEATLGVPIYPAAQFLTSYDAGRGQRYYLYGSGVGFGELVAYYRNVLKTKGELVFETPPTHMFDTGRFREESMAFPPSVTIKDYTWDGSEGYPNPKPGGTPPTFKTVIQIVPAQAETLR